MLDVAGLALIRDMAEKAGVDSVIEYWIRVGETLANRMGEEAYIGWPAFNMAVKDSRASISTEGETFALTDLAILDKDGDVAGYIYAVRECPYKRTLERYINAVGEIPKADLNVVEQYNNSIRDSTVCNFCIFHQVFREKVISNITIAQQDIEYLQLANRGYMGKTKIVEENLKRINIRRDHVSSLLRSYSCVFALIIKGAVIT